MTLSSNILEIFRRAPLLCKRCCGQGQIFSTLTINPSERPKWLECHDCNGTGETPEPQCEGEEE